MMASIPEPTTDRESFLHKLKTDGKGWNVALFEPSPNLGNLLCEHCKSVCCGAVELGCRHSEHELEIFLYCHQCLNEMILNNNHKCPLNQHAHPVIYPNRVSRRQILESMVHCPFSFGSDMKATQYDGIGHAMVIDTPGADTKSEGLTTSASKRILSGACSWKGTLLDLIANHLEQCTRQHDTASVHQSDTKALHEQIQNLQSELSTQIEVNKMLQSVLNQQQQRMHEQPSVLYAHHAQCSECKTYPICGIRYVCTNRPNYNLCAKCEHDLMRDGLLQHPMYKMYNPLFPIPQQTEHQSMHGDGKEDGVELKTQSDTDIARKDEKLHRKKKKAKQKPVEPSAKQKQWREKQIALGKSTVGYRKYVEKHPNNKEELYRVEHGLLSTPDPQEKVSKKKWTKKYQKWRRFLHQFG